MSTYSIYEKLIDDDGYEERDYHHEGLDYDTMFKVICMLRCCFPHRDFVEEQDEAPAPVFKRVTLKLVVNNEKAN